MFGKQCWSVSPGLQGQVLIALHNVCAVHRSTPQDIMSTLEDIMSTLGDNMSTLGVLSTLGHIMINVGDTMIM